MPYETAPVRGVEVHYGRRVTDESFGGDLGTKDGVRQKSYSYDYNNLPAADANELVLDFPAYSKVVSVYTEVLEDIVGLTSPTVQAVVGSYDSGADALSAATRGGVAKDEPAAPTLVGTSAAELAITLGGTGTATAGKLRTVVTYMVEGAN